MDKRPPDLLVSIFRACRLAMHLLHGILLAVIFPHLHQTVQSRVLMTWSRKLLEILNVCLQIEGQLPMRGEGGCLIVANHISWLDIFVLNAIYPARFIAKSEVCGWPVIGWLCRRSGTIFIERAARPKRMSQDASLINQRVRLSLEQGACIGLFPEGTTTDGQQVGHFHSALMQPVIDAKAKLCPVALRYRNGEGKPSSAAAFTGDMTLAQSIWKILRCQQHNALVVYTPTLAPDGANRRVLARAAQQAITEVLQLAGTIPQIPIHEEVPASAQTIFSSQSAYALLIDLNQLPK